MVKQIAGLLLTQPAFAILPRHQYAQRRVAQKQTVTSTGNASVMKTSPSDGNMPKDVKTYNMEIICVTMNLLTLMTLYRLQELQKFQELCSPTIFNSLFSNLTMALNTNSVLLPVTSVENLLIHNALKSSETLAKSLYLQLALLPKSPTVELESIGSREQMVDAPSLNMRS